MSKKNWIFIKRGLSEDPKHREKMGMAIWLFMHICDAADWETGRVYDWRDKEIGIDMTLSTNTVREWRQKLADLGYITCEQKQHCLEIIIHNWNNPHQYDTPKINVNQGNAHVSPSNEKKAEGKPQGKPQALDESRANPTPFIESSSSSSSPSEGTAAVFKTYTSEIGLITSKIADSINDLLDHGTPPEWITEALEISSKQNHRSWAYAEAILKRWTVEGKGDKRRQGSPERHLPTVAELEAAGML
jgi:DnaD/phage-associated family protein